MRVEIPGGLIDFAKEFSIYKTPRARTQGWKEQAHEVRGRGDFMDTVGTLMLWRYLVQEGIHATYYLSGNGGDETDIRIHSKGGNLDLNVKTSAWQPPDDALLPVRGHIAVKSIEFDKTLPDLYAQIIIHDNPIKDSPHVHLCNFIAVESEKFIKHAEGRNKNTIPATNGTKGLWIPSADAENITELPRWLISKSQ